MITLSAGIASMPEHGSTESELLKAADEAMYAAKQAGRDRIAIYQTALIMISPNWGRQNLPGRWMRPGRFYYMIMYRYIY